MEIQMRKVLFLTVALLWANANAGDTTPSLFPAAVSAQSVVSNCDYPELKNQKEDEATIQRLELAWTEAFLRGDTVFMRCLLAPNFTEIMRGGELRTLQDELAKTEQNKGKNLKVPELPKIQVLLHENAAVAYGNSVVDTPDGKKGNSMVLRQLCLERRTVARVLRPADRGAGPVNDFPHLTGVLRHVSIHAAI
jgi:hypothetical protein